jgi:hypothetical protein
MRDPSSHPERRLPGIRSRRMLRIHAESQMRACCPDLDTETAWLGLPCCDGWERQCGSCGRRSAIHERVCESGEATLAGNLD